MAQNFHMRFSKEGSSVKISTAACVKTILDIITVQSLK